MKNEQREAARRWACQNRAAARRVDSALHATKRGKPEVYADESQVQDLLTDIRHWCDAHDREFAELDAAAYRHYSAERVQAITGVDQ